MANKKVLITGVNGQDASYLTEFLLEKGYDVYGIIRRTSQFNRSRIEKTIDNAKKRGLKFELIYGEQSAPNSFSKIIHKYKPSEIYNLASQSHVGISFEEPEITTEVNANSVLRILESIKNFQPDCRLYQASTSEMFGNTTITPQTEDTPFAPLSPYAVSKMYAYWIVRTYREAYSIHAGNGILYNHESPRRGENFVTRKITYSLARIKTGTQNILELGNIDTKRDWGFAGDYVKAMWKILQQPEADDFIISTGKLHSVREFVEKAATLCGYDIEWEGSGINEIGLDKKTGKTIVKINSKYYRPVEPKVLCGDNSKAKKILGWEPQTSFDELVEMMMKYDLDNMQRQRW